VLREIRINATTQEGLDVIPTKDIDLVVTLGAPDGVQPPSPLRAKQRTWDWDVPDPCREPRADLDAFRHARDKINNKVGGLFLDYRRNLALSTP
jgi:hypothetical protein